MITDARAPDRSTILVNSHFGGWPPWSGKLTAPLLCMVTLMFIINIIFLARAVEKYFLPKKEKFYIHFLRKIFLI